MAMETAAQTAYSIDDLEGDMYPLTGGEIPFPSSIVMGSALESRYLTTGFAGLAAITLGSFL